MSPLMSMTGFGRSERTSPLGTCAVEAKSVNHRFLEPRVFVPRDLAVLEIPLTRRVKDRLSRGKVDVSMRWTPAPELAPAVSFRLELMKAYADRISGLAREMNRSDTVPLEYLLDLPGVSEKTTPEINEDALGELFSGALDEALDALVAERVREGAALATEISERLNVLADLREKVDAEREEVVRDYREKLLKKAEDWAQDARIQMEPGRLESEVMMFADKADLTEEIVRLGAHIDAFRDLLAKADDTSSDAPESHGKPMEFLTQELLRETNTIASKARHTGVVSNVLAMKNEIEKIREQVLNVE